MSEPPILGTPGVMSSDGQRSRVMEMGKKKKKPICVLHQNTVAPAGHKALKVKIWQGGNISVG